MEPRVLIACGALRLDHQWNHFCLWMCFDLVDDVQRCRVDKSLSWLLCSRFDFVCFCFVLCFVGASHWREFCLNFAVACHGARVELEIN